MPLHVGLGLVASGFLIVGLERLVGVGVGQHSERSHRGRTFSESFLQDYFKLIREAIADGQQSGAFRKDISATTATKIFFGALDEMATNWVLSKRRYSLIAEADVVVDLIVGGIGARNGRAKSAGAEQA